MRTIILTLLLAVSSVATMAQMPSNTNEQQKLPNSWFMKAKGYEKALALQKGSGADILVVFTRDVPASEKGLCQWFDSKGLNASKVRDYLKDYIKVTVPLPSNPECQKMAEDFDVRKCPAVFIVQPDSKQYYCKVFEYPDGHPKLFPPETLIELFRARSSERYQTGPGSAQDSIESRTE
jgi:hypothetical protein